MDSDSKNSRLYENLNKNFLPGQVHHYTHQAAVIWAFLEKSFSKMAKNSFKPTQLEVIICFNEHYTIADLSDGTKEILQISSLQGIIDVIPRAKFEGLKVDLDLSKKEFTFTFTPSNY